MTSSYFLPDTAVALAALAGLLIVIRRLRSARRADALTHYFRASLTVVAWFLAARTLYWITQAEAFLHVALFIAPIISVMALLLSEALIRRHAPVLIKGFIAFGAVVLAFSSLSHRFIYTDSYSYILLSFQLLSFVLIGWLVVLRDRKTLSGAENNMIDRVSLSLLFILPFLISDYRFASLEIPVRMSGIAILATCWLALNLNRPSQSRTSQLAILGLVMVVSLIGAGVLCWHLNSSATQSVQIWAVIFALILLVQIARDDLLLSHELKREALQIDPGSEAEGSLEKYLVHLAQKGALDDVLIISQASLEEFDKTALNEIFVQNSELTIGDLPAKHENDDLAQSQLRALFSSNAADQVYLVAREPLMLAFVRSRGLMSTSLDRDLSSGFRLARLIAQRDHLAASVAGK